MTNEVRESGGNEINFSSSKADLTSQRKRAAVLPHYKAKHRNTPVTVEGNQARKILWFCLFHNQNIMKIVCVNVFVFLQLQMRATSDRWGKTLQVRSSPCVT